jgi:hypothetical protein
MAYVMPDEPRRQEKRRRHKIPYSVQKPREAKRHDVGKPTPSVATLIIATSAQESTYSVHNRREAQKHDTRKPTPSVATHLAAKSAKDSRDHNRKEAKKQIWKTDA